MRPWSNLRESGVALTAGLGWLGLGIILYVVIDSAVTNGRSVAEGLLSYICFFTVVANILAATVLTAHALKSRTESFFTSVKVMSAAAVYTTVVAIGYMLWPSKFWTPQDPVQTFASILLHDLVPLLYLLFWLILVPKGTLRWAYPIVWLSVPLTYLCYVFVYGKLSGYYPYPVINVHARGYAGALTSASLLLLMTFVGGLILVAVDRIAARR
jgi:hypothetical protein